MGAAGIIYLGGLLLAVAGWSLIMRQLDVHLGFRQNLYIYGVTLIVGRIPGAPWHLAGRVVLYKRLGIDGRITGVAAGLEMILVLVSGLLSSLLIWFMLPSAIQMQMVWLAIPCFLCVVLIHPSVINWVLKRLGYTKTGIQLRYRDLLGWLCVYLLVWVIGGCVLYALVFGLYPLPLSQLLSMIGVWSLSGSIALMAFFIPAGLGIKEVTLSLLLGMFIPLEIGIITAILARLFLTAIELVGAVAISRYLTFGEN